MNRHFPLFALLFLCVSIAQAGNWQWLRNTGLESLSDTDWEILSGSLNSALKSAPDGKTVHWQNPESGSQGDIRLIATLPSQDGNCRKVQLTTVTARKHEGKPLTFCRSAEGNWLIASPSSKEKERQNKP